MKIKINTFLFFVFILISMVTLIQCKNKIPSNVTALKLNLNQVDPVLKPFDSAFVNVFFEKYPELEHFKKDVLSVYRNHHFNYIWHDSKGRKETAEVLYNRINAISEEGILHKVPYKEVFDVLLQTSLETDLTNELFLTSYYFFYTSNVLAGIDPKKREEMGWFLERESVSYVSYLDTLLSNPGLVNKTTQLNKQYYLLKDVLEDYKKISQNGGWDSIKVPDSFKSLKLNDSSVIVQKTRKRLYISGDLKEDSGSAVFDKSLAYGISIFQKRAWFCSG